MPETILPHSGGKTNSHSAATHTEASPTASLERGTFSDGVRTFTVRASSTTAPDSFNVCANMTRSEVVMVISGLNTGELRSSWAPEWKTASETWRDWFEATAFMVFYNGKRPSTGRVRFCNG